MSSALRVSSARASPCPAGLRASTAAGRPLRSGIRAPQRTRSRPSAVAVRAVIDVNTETFEAEVLRAPGVVLVDYWATWCGPCKLISPIMEWAEQEYPGLKVVKIETDPNPDLVEKYKVYGLPTIMLFRDGELVADSHNEGAISKKTLDAYLSTHGVTTMA